MYILIYIYINIYKYTCVYVCICVSPNIGIVDGGQVYLTMATSLRAPGRSVHCRTSLGPSLSNIPEGTHHFIVHILH